MGLSRDFVTQKIIEFRRIMAQTHELWNQSIVAVEVEGQREILGKVQYVWFPVNIFSSDMLLSLWVHNDDMTPSESCDYYFEQLNEHGRAPHTEDDFAALRAKLTDPKLWMGEVVQMFNNNKVIEDALSISGDLGTFPYHGPLHNFIIVQPDEALNLALKTATRMIADWS